MTFPTLPQLHQAARHHDELYEWFQALCKAPEQAKKLSEHFKALTVTLRSDGVIVAALNGVALTFRFAMRSVPRNEAPKARVYVNLDNVFVAPYREVFLGSFSFNQQGEVEMLMEDPRAVELPDDAGTIVLLYLDRALRRLDQEARHQEPLPAPR